ncbi:lysophospholipase [Spiroplasma sp. NBRC 100390]|uniref:alpha/beta hydrolase n=1 Tax=unclassified Spiroplasma TaxID=2637901 RepID=UPI0008927D82|nr:MULTISPECIES: alpha/beta hydrolase [unclassified Spiroplasma]AOX44138.1 lysophospholipase [Spiroplasma sp. TU-14]APE13608.1 lysophospholipase [Spiroplasma sp. NBRC 100390]
MKFKEWKQQLRDGSELQMYEWKPANDKDIRGVVQLVHGSAEHSLRYEDFAKFLVANNYAVVAEDHRGHGKTATCSENLGFFAEEEGWEKIIDDLYEVTTYIKHCYPNRPIVMFGHSMGSFMVRHYAIKYGTNIAALVICGTAHYPKRLLKFSIKMARIGQKIKGPKSKDNFIYKFSYAPLNVRYKDEGNLGTEWLATDKTVQEAFANDPLTGQVFSTSAFKDMFTGLLFITNKKNIKLTPNTLPLLFIAGQDDPVGKYGKTVLQTVELYKKAGKRVKVKLYPNARHEILNEPIKQEIYQDILNFYNKSLFR